jgi:RNA recognition motif-containing protein
MLLPKLGASCLIAATVMTDKVTNRPKGFGFVKFASEEEANNAREEMNGKARLSFCRVLVLHKGICFLMCLGEELTNARL